MHAQASALFASIDKSVERFWDIEHDSQGVSNKFALSIQDRKVLELWDRECIFVDGHYQLPIPWVNGNPNFPNNRHIAQKRLDNLLGKLERANLVERYDDGVKELLSNGYAEAVPVGECNLQDHSVWYLPHRHVINPLKPEKLRIVFDCAAQLGNISLNSECYQGQT